MALLGADRLTPKIRVLIADNEETMVQTLAAVLDLAGYEICALYTGDTTMRLLNLLRPELDLIDLNAREPARSITSVALPYVSRCKVLLSTEQMTLHDLLLTTDVVAFPFELVLRPVRTADLLLRLQHSICSERPPLLVPIETDELHVH